MRFAIVDEMGATRDYADSREDADQLAAQADDLFVVDLFCPERAGRRAVAKHRDALRLLSS